MPVEVLDADMNSAAWRRILSTLPGSTADVYFQPEYVGLHRFVRAARATLFVYQQGSHVWAYPFLLQPIALVGEKPLSEEWFDIEAPYGYGGPLANTDNTHFLAEAHESFSNWCKEHKVVSEFVRLHPIFDTQQWLDPRVKITFDRKTVSLDLEAMRGGKPPFDKNTRYMLRRAEQAGIRVTDSLTPERFERFVSLYLRTMDKLAAEDYYYFNRDYFDGLASLVRDRGWLLVAQRDQEWIAAALFLKGSAWIHYHLSASDPARYVPGATNALIYAAAQRGEASGFQALHLGGGLTSAAEDTLLRFKRSMSTHSHNFCVGTRVHNMTAYRVLRATWEEQFPDLVGKYGNRILFYRYRYQSRDASQNS